MQLDTEKSTATRSAEEMAPEAPQPLARRKIESKTKKREPEDYAGNEVAR